MQDATFLMLPAIAAVLGLVWLAGAAFRKGWLRLPGLPSAGGPTASAARLALVQTIAIDPRRRLHLVRCDGAHVLLLTGGVNDLQVRCPCAKPHAP